MAKKQTRRSISVSRTTYERLKAFCEANNVSMSQFVETRVATFWAKVRGQRRSCRPCLARPSRPMRRARCRSPGADAPDDRVATRRAATGADDVRRGALCDRATAAVIRKQEHGGTEAGREASRPDLQVLIGVRRK